MSAASWNQELLVLEGRVVNFGDSETGNGVISSVFVYGTLKRGQCRGAMWPFEPLKVSVVFTHGKLFDRPDYPAMTSGTDDVVGEKWDFRPEQMPRVLEVLDAIEGANQQGVPDLYRRVVVTTWDLCESGTNENRIDAEISRKSYTYHYASDPTDDGFTRIMPDQSAETSVRLCVQWPTAS
ncbi:MAG: gamma-glutamylcyclotransferase family protein [Rubripirellula sp.]